VEVEQYFPVYGFYRYTEEEIPRPKDRMRRRTKIYLLCQQEEKNIHIQSKNLYSKNELGLL
jgi:hypothetical protein